MTDNPFAALLDGVRRYPILGNGNVMYETAVLAALAAMTKERDELRACIAWVDEVYPERIEAGGAGIQITWEEFNAMQATIGVTVDKRIGGPEGKAVHNHRLRSALAAERAKTAKLVEALRLIELIGYREGEGFGWINAHMRGVATSALTGESIEHYWRLFPKHRAAITEAGQ